MAEAPFKKGDVIALKSGGPLMTVEAMNPYRDNTGWQVEAIWYAEPKFERLLCTSDVFELVPEDAED